MVGFYVLCKIEFIKTRTSEWTWLLQQISLLKDNYCNLSGNTFIIFIEIFTKNITVENHKLMMYVHVQLKLDFSLLYLTATDLLVRWPLIRSHLMKRIKLEKINNVEDRSLELSLPSLSARKYWMIFYIS